MPLQRLLLLLQAGMYQNIGNISVVGVIFDSNVATGSGGGLYQNSFAGEAAALLRTHLGQWQVGFTKTCIALQTMTNGYHKDLHCFTIVWGSDACVS